MSREGLKGLAIRAMASAKEKVTATQWSPGKLGQKGPAQILEIEAIDSHKCVT
jgi:hypothetical protein